MNELTQIKDFDLRINEILLVHKNTFVQDYTWNSYRTGRTIDGLVLCSSGRGKFIFPNQTIYLEKGQMFFLSSENAYIVKNCDSAPFVHYTANFRLNRENIADTSPLLTTLLAGQLHYTTTTIQFAHHRNIFDELLSVWQTKTCGYRLLAKSFLYDLLYHYLIEAAQYVYHPNTYHKLIPAQELLDRSYVEEHSITELAELCGLSESHFRRLFSQLYGCSPVEYRKRKRLLHAKDLLLSGAYSISEVSHMAGFANQNYFARFFKKEMGMSPSEYIKLFFN